MTRLKKIGLILLVAGYLLAGINHFINPDFYTAIIPAYIPFPALMNGLAGVAEILLALMLIYSKKRALAAWGIVLLLGVFTVVHIDMILKAPYQIAGLNVKLWLAWLRLLMQPVLMWWAYLYTKEKLQPRNKQP